MFSLPASVFVSIWGFCSFGGVEVLWDLCTSPKLNRSCYKSVLAKNQRWEECCQWFGVGTEGKYKKGDLGHLPWKWVIIYTRQVVVCHLYLLQWKVDTCYFQTQICHSLPLYSFWMDINCDQIYQAHKGWHLSTGVCCPDDGAIRKQVLIKAEARSWEGTAVQGKP